MWRRSRLPSSTLLASRTAKGWWWGVGLCFSTSYREGLLWGISEEAQLSIRWLTKTTLQICCRSSCTWTWCRWGWRCSLASSWRSTAAEPSWCRGKESSSSRSCSSPSSRSSCPPSTSSQSSWPSSRWSASVSATVHVLSSSWLRSCTTSGWGLLYCGCSFSSTGFRWAGLWMGWGSVRCAWSTWCSKSGGSCLFQGTWWRPGADRGKTFIKIFGRAFFPTLSATCKTDCGSRRASRNWSSHWSSPANDVQK